MPRDKSNAPPVSGAEASYAAGDVVQVTDEAHDWYGTLLVVDEAGRFKLRAFFQEPTQGCAYIFILHHQVTRIGRVALTMA